jgi:peptidoglycan biosynthesis protein MviN/MurJ (putative lipid II flippase)
MTFPSLDDIPRDTLTALAVPVALSALAGTMLVLCALGGPHALTGSMAGMWVVQSAVNGAILAAYFKLNRRSRRPARSSARIRPYNVLLAVTLTTLVFLALTLASSLAWGDLGAVITAGGLLLVIVLAFAVFPSFCFGPRERK